MTVLASWFHRRHRKAHGGGIGGVGFEQQVRLSPRNSLREKSTGMVTANCTLPSASSFMDFRRAVRLARDVEIAAVLAAPRYGGAGKRAVVRRINRRGQMLGIRVDGVAEENELDHRDAHHHAERQPVAPHLDEFLHDDGPKRASQKLKARPSLKGRGRIVSRLRAKPQQPTGDERRNFEFPLPLGEGQGEGKS
jgi:hypothetical protein